MVAGKPFNEATETEKSNGLIINETFAKTFEGDAINQKLSGTRFGEHRIIGVVKDFHYASLHQPIKPLVLSLESSFLFSGIEGLSMNQSTRPTVMIKTKLKNYQEVKDRVKSIWEARFQEPYRSFFLDDRLEKLYEREQKANALTTLISILAIIIACLGLLGLAALTIKNKLKEIGIRKVLGASSISILKKLYKVFFGPIILAFLVSIPLTHFAMDGWLQSFEYRINVGIIHFSIALILVLLVTLAVVSFQSARAARVNPVDTLRDE